MLADTMFPEAYNSQRTAGILTQKAVGLMTVLGFAVAYTLSMLE